MKNKFLEKSNIVLFTGYVMGKGYDINELKNKGDTDIIASLYAEFLNKLNEMESKS